MPNQLLARGAAASQRQTGRGVVSPSMRAARLHDFGEPLVVDHLARPEPRDTEVLLRVAAAGVGRRDLAVIAGRVSGVSLPHTPGHEVAGYVAAVGASVRGLEVGEAVLVHGAWGCGRCAACARGDEDLCASGRICGSTAEGGFADFVLLPHHRHAVAIDGLDPVRAAPLGGAGLAAYRAVQRARPRLMPGSAAVVIGAGAAGQVAIQLLDAMTPAFVVAVDVDPHKEAAAREAGAAEVIDLLDAGAVAAALGGRAAVAVLDCTGSTAAARVAAEVAGPLGEVIAATSGGRVDEIAEVVALAQTGILRSRVQRFQLDRANDALAALRAGWVAGRAVIVPMMA